MKKSVGGAGPEPGIDRRTLIRRAALAGVTAWSAPAILGSIASPAAAATGACYLFVIRLRRDGLNPNGNAMAVISDLATCATTVTGGTGCTIYTRITNNTTNPPGPLTLTVTYDGVGDQFQFSATATGFPTCGFVGSAVTAGTTSTTLCESTVSLSSFAKAQNVAINVPATDGVNNVAGWVYLAVQC